MKENWWHLRRAVAGAFANVIWNKCWGKSLKRGMGNGCGPPPPPIIYRLKTHPEQAMLYQSGVLGVNFFNPNLKDVLVSKERRVTRLTRDANRIWLLEFFGTATLEDLRQIPAGEINGILNLLKKTEVQKLIVDLSPIQNFSSRDLQVLVTLYKELVQHNVAIVLRNPGPYLSRVLRIMQLDRMFEIEPDENFHKMK